MKTHACIACALAALSIGMARGPDASVRERPVVPVATGCRADRAALEAALRAVHEKQRNVGLGAAVAVRGEPILSIQLGLADVEHAVPVGEDTRFGIASVTKAFTGVTVLKLAERGAIDLDRPIEAYVPAFPPKGDTPITLRHLVAHLSGLPHPTDRTPELFATHYTTATDAVAFIKDVELVAPVGSKYLYSSSNYNLLAAAVEGATGRSFQDVVREEVLAPLGLARTSFDNVLRPLPHRARRYSFYHPRTYAESDTLFVVPTMDYSFNPGGGNLTSTAGDLVRFGLALVRPGLLSATALDALYTRMRVGAVTSGVSFGWFVPDGPRWIFMSGSNPGVQAALGVWPDEQMAIAVLANTWGIGSRSGEMVNLPGVLRSLCLGDERR